MKNLIGQKNNDSAKPYRFQCICSEGTSYYFEQFHTSNQEACNLICELFGI